MPKEIEGAGKKLSFFIRYANGWDAQRYLREENELIDSGARTH